MIVSDFLVIGSGIAGLCYALHMAEHGEVAVLCKREAIEGNTRYAQGGIASVTSPADSFESHIEDTLIAGAGLCKKGGRRNNRQRRPKACSTTHRLGHSIRQRCTDSRLPTRQRRRSFRKKNTSC